MVPDHKVCKAQVYLTSNSRPLISMLYSWKNKAAKLKRLLCFAKVVGFAE